MGENESMNSRGERNETPGGRTKRDKDKYVKVGIGGLVI